MVAAELQPTERNATTNQDAGDSCLRVSCQLVSAADWWLKAKTILSSKVLKSTSHMIGALATHRLKECTELPRSTCPSIQLSPQCTCIKTACLSIHLSHSRTPVSLYLFVVFHLKCGRLSFWTVKCEVTERKRECFWWKSTKIKNRLTIIHACTFYWPVLSRWVSTLWSLVINTD